MSSMFTAIQGGWRCHPLTEYLAAPGRAGKIYFRSIRVERSAGRCQPSTLGDPLQDRGEGWDGDIPESGVQAICARYAVAHPRRRALHSRPANIV